VPVSVRLDARTERVVERLARRSGRTKSDVIRQAIAALDQEETALPRTATAYDRLAHLIGGSGSGRKDVSERTGEAFRKAVEAKDRARRTR